ncbi:MAG: ribonuclease III [Chitinophagales bacterium]
MKKLIGFTPVNVAIFKLAFKHSSKALKSHKSNERLEYLGDAVLDTIISDYLFRKYPLKGEGFLTEMRSKIVKRKKLGEIGERLELQRFLDYDMKYVSINSTILGNAFEALIGAIYLDAGYHATKEFVLESIIKAYIDLDNLQEQDINFKSRLFEWAQKYDRALEFRVEEEKMRGSIRFFIVGAYVDDKRLGIGEGRSKKDAQKAAAKVVYIKLNVGAEIEGP